MYLLEGLVINRNRSHWMGTKRQEAQSQWRRVSINGRLSVPISDHRWRCTNTTTYLNAIEPLCAHCTENTKARASFRRLFWNHDALYCPHVIFNYSNTLERF